MELIYGYYNSKVDNSVKAYIYQVQKKNGFYM